MKLKGVITGDIISSTTIKPEWRQRLLNSMERLVAEFNQFCPVKIEFFRGIGYLERVLILTYYKIKLIFVCIILDKFQYDYCFNLIHAPMY